MNMKTFYMLGLLLLCLCKINAQDDLIDIGRKYTFKSEILSEERSYWVSLPASYNQAHSSYRSYPVIYLLDGHIHFASVAGMCQFMGRPSNGSRKMPEVIVVGVMNVDRQRDFTPDKIITRRANNTGGGKAFLSFLEEELIPEIDRNFRTASYRILFGHSLGGLLTTHAYLQDKSSFNAFLAIDPSFGTWDHTIMDEKLEAVSLAVFDRLLYMATANWEKRNIRNRDRHLRFYESLNSRCEDSFNGKLTYFEDESHSTVSLPAFYDAMSFLFEGYNFSYRNAGDIESVTSVYEQLSDRLGYSFKTPEELINRIGYAKLRSRDDAGKELALSYFKLNVRLYPESYNVYDSLGDAEYRLGSLDKSVECYEQSLALNPENSSAKEMIAKIQTESSSKGGN